MPELLPLWPNDVRPTVSLQTWRAAQPNGSGVLVCPGGGYGGLATGHEGDQIATWLNERGFDAWVLRYSIATPQTPGPLGEKPLQDAQRALHLIHHGPNAPKQLGIWGFSAGGHLAATVSTHWQKPIDVGNIVGVAAPVDPMPLRPDFTVLAYPVVTMAAWSHGGSRRNLLGENATPEQIELFSNELHVNAQTPPCFLFHTNDDPGVPVENSLRYALALNKNRVPCELHVYRSGPHGVGLALQNDALKSWSQLLEKWLQQFISPVT